MILGILCSLKAKTLQTSKLGKNAPAVVVVAVDVVVLVVDIVVVVDVVVAVDVVVVLAKVSSGPIKTF